MFRPPVFRATFTPASLSENQNEERKRPDKIRDRAHQVFPLPTSARAAGKKNKLISPDYSEAPFVCPHCGKRFDREKWLIGHCRVYHKKEAPYVPRGELSACLPCDEGEGE